MTEDDRAEVSRGPRSDEILAKRMTGYSMTGYSMTDPFGQVRPWSRQLAVVVALTVMPVLSSVRQRGYPTKQVS